MDPMKAEFEIRQLHARYADGVFRKDLEALAPLFTNDCEWRVGGMTMQGRDAILDLMQGVFGQFSRILMTFRTPIVDVGAEGVTARTYVTEQSAYSDGRPFGPIGLYYDRFAVAYGALRFNWRLFQTHYAGTPDLPAPVEFLDVADYGPPPAMPPLDEETVDRSGLSTSVGKG